MLTTTKALTFASSSNKLSQDINFLLERLSMMQEQSPPNIQMQETYQDMLERRIDILAELLELHPKSDELEVAPFKFGCH